MIKSFKYRICPTKRQIAALSEHLSEACRLYNAALQERRDAYQVAGKPISFYDQHKQLKEIRAAGDLGITNFSCARDVLRRIDRAFSAFFRRVKSGQTPGYPRFKSFRRYDSVTFPDYGHGVSLLPNAKLRLQGIGEIKLKLHRPIEGRIKTTTVKRDAGKWYVCFSVECDAEPLPPSVEAVGLDLGASSIFATFSDGSTVRNPRCNQMSESVLRVAQRKVSRRNKGSNGRRKAITLLQRAYARIRNRRADFHHKLSRSLVNKFGLIAIEGVNIEPLAKGFTAKPIYDAGWGLFIEKLTYKAESAGRVLVKVDPAGTSQTCLCGEAVPKSVRTRWHECPACGLVGPRDEVSAKLILALGLSVAGLTWPTGACVPAKASSL